MLNRSKDLYKIGVDVGGTFTDIVIYDESNSKLFEEKLSQETFAGDVVKYKMLGRETRVFSLPSSKPARGSHVVGGQWDKTIQDCFSWLSE